MKGDNFYGSEDSQFWGFVPKGNIIGKVVFIIMSKEHEESIFSGFKISKLFKLIH